MHAQAGTTGYDLITDEYARQQAKKASRERYYSIILDDPTYDSVEEFILALLSLGITQPETVTGGTSTPSTAASPPHDAEADREAKRLEAAAHLADVLEQDVAPTPAYQRPIRDVADFLEHLARQHKDLQRSAVLHGLDSSASFRMGQHNAYANAALIVRDLLR